LTLNMPSDKPLISVIVPVYNSMGVLETCLRSILAAMAHFGKAELILIDNGSTDGSYELLREGYGRDAKVLQQGSGTIASLRNRGAELADGQYLCFIDSDCVISARHLHNALDVFNTVNPAATGCKYDLPPSPHWVEETWSQLHRRDKDGYVNYLNAGNFIIKKSVFDRIGGFDERLPTDEDADLGGRMLAAGLSIYEAHDVSATHLGNPKSVIGFFKKELWHGSGMFRMHSRPYLDKVFLATILHVCLFILGIILALALKISLGWRIAAVFFALLPVPAATLCFRFGKSRKVYRPLRALLLYCVFFAAKGVAMIREFFRALGR